MEPQSLDSIEALQRWLQEQSTRHSHAFRGHARASWQITSTLDRDLGYFDTPPQRPSRKAALAREETILELFEEQLLEHLPAHIKPYFHQGTHNRDRVIAWQVMQHYGAPTRLVDWTRSPYFACLFACCEHERCDAVIWWYDAARYTARHLTRQNWKRWKVKYRKDTQQAHFEIPALGKPIPALFVMNMKHNTPFLRMKTQEGFHTASARFGVDHGRYLRVHLGSSGFGGVLIRSEWKQPMRAWLWNTLGLNAASIDWPIADKIARELLYGQRRSDYCATPLTNTPS